MPNKLIGLLKIVHPLPSIAMTLAALVLSLPLNDNYNFMYFLLFGIVILLENFIVGLTNDLIDYRFDMIVKTHKPLVNGSISKKESYYFLFILSCLLTIAITFFNFEICLFFLLGLSCGLSYNFGLKKTPFSFVPYIIAIPTVAIVARFVNGDFPFLLFWIYPLGALMSLVLHLTNQMNKAEESNNSGEKNLLHIVGVKKGQILCVGTIICTLILFTIISIHYNLDIRLMTILNIISLIFIVLFIFLSKINKRKSLFPLSIILSVIMGSVFLQMIILL